jgi:hypothetical protein
MKRTRNDTIHGINLGMLFSGAIGAPIEGIPDKTLKLIQLMLPHLVENTTPKEAAIVVACAYLFFAALLMTDTEGLDRQIEFTEIKSDIGAAKDLLDAALEIIAQVLPDTADK